jgi:Bacterial SH3 domain
MDARRFDLLSRGIARFGSRRTLLRSFALAAGSAAASTRAVRADGDLAVGGSDGVAVCPPSRRPTRQVTGVAPFPAFVVAGVCDDLDERTSYNLIDAGSDDAGETTTGADAAVRVERSMTSIRVPLDDLLAEPHAIIIRAGGANKELIACGEIGGVLNSTTVALGLKERNGSGYAGVANLRGTAGQTAIDIFIAQDLFELANSWEGAIVVTTIEVNLRTQPSESADVITVLAEGTVLTVTGPETGAWIPVENGATGDTGYVNLAYVEVQ